MYKRKWADLVDSLTYGMNSEELYNFIRKHSQLMQLCIQEIEEDIKDSPLTEEELEESGRIVWERLQEDIRCYHFKEHST